MICQKCRNLMVALRDTDLEMIGDIIDPFAASSENSEVWYCTRCGHITYRQ